MRSHQGCAIQLISFQIIGSIRLLICFRAEIFFVSGGVQVVFQYFYWDKHVRKNHEKF